MFKKLSLIAGLAALTTALAVATAGANTTPVSVSLSGTQTVVDESTGTYTMQGSLVGSWQTTKFVPRYQSASQFVATGKELFVGCLDSDKSGVCDKKEPSGTLKFTFVYWASFDPSTGAFLSGHCVHPITQGTGSFKKASGTIFMEDTPTATGVVTTYTGSLDYLAPKSGQTAAHRTLASASASGHHGAGCVS